MFNTKLGRSLVVLCIGAMALTYTGCARTPQAKRDKYIAAGKKQMEKKDYGRAVLEFKNAVQAMPDDAESYYQLGVAYDASGDAKGAYAGLKKAVQLDPKHQQGATEAGASHGLSGRSSAGAAGRGRAEEALGDSPTPEVLNSLALAQLRLGETGDATESLEEALKTSPQELRSSIMLARTKFSQKDVAGAEEVLKKACESAPKSSDARIVLGEFYVGQHRWPEGEAEFQKALAIDPKRYRALIDLAQVQNASGEKQQAEQNFKRLAESGEKSLKPVHALFLFNNGQQDAAILEFEKLFKQDPNDRIARTRLVSAYEVVHRTADAEKVLADALKKNAHDVDALSQRAELLLNTGKFADAEKDLTEVVRSRPDSADTHYAMSKVHKAQGQRARQQQDLSEALRLNPYFLTARIELAQLLAADKDNKGALELLDRASDNQKQSIQWVAMRNWILWASGDMAELRKGVDRGLAMAKTPDFLIQDGLWNLRAGKYPPAEAAFEQALKVAPGDVRALQALYASYQLRKAGPAGVAKVKEYAAQAPKAPAMQEYLGAMLLQNGDRAGARAAYNAAKAADPKFVQADFALAQMDVLENKLDDARNRLKTILAANDRNSMAHLWLGMVQRSSGNPAAAIDEYRKAVAVDAQNTQALNNLAYELADTANKPDEALSFAEKARELDPANPHMADTLGWIYYRKGMYSAAIKQMETGAAQDQGNAVIKYHLAMAYAKSGDSRKGSGRLCKPR